MRDVDEIAAELALLQGDEFVAGCSEIFARERAAFRKIGYDKRTAQVLALALMAGAVNSAEAMENDSARLLRQAGLAD